VGTNYGTISNVYATGNVSGHDNIGGLVGRNYGTISNAYATGNVSGHYNIGGLVGDNYDGTISNAYATGDVSGNNNIGGLVGSNNGHRYYYSYYYSPFVGCVACGGSSRYGGTVITISSTISSTISNAYATGSVSGIYAVGGLVGNNNEYGIINNAFWNTETTGKDINSGIGSNQGALNNISGKTTAEMMQLATFSSAGWDIANNDNNGTIWLIYEGETAPLLRGINISYQISNSPVNTPPAPTNSQVQPSGNEPNNYREPAPNLDLAIKLPLRPLIISTENSYPINWFYQHWLPDLFFQTPYKDLASYWQYQVANTEVEVVDTGMTMPQQTGQ
jgi:hypothetical protein